MFAESSRVALYARVSTEGQEQEQTVQSQLAELRARIKEDGHTGCQEYVDEGYSRDNLTRPALDRLLAAIRGREVSHLYVQAPDRLASGGKFIFVYEEIRKAGVVIVFLKGSAEDTPEGKLLLHMQSAFAEYEHTKIAERTRRGKKYWAEKGVLPTYAEPYGYTFVRRSDDQRAHLVLNPETAPIVRMMFGWLVNEKMSTRGIALRLTELGIPTSKRAAIWHDTAVQRILTNDVYLGILYVNRRESVEPKTRKGNPYTHGKTSFKLRDRTEWQEIEVPQVIEPELWEAGQRQLKANSQFALRNTRRKYLLRGLPKCPRCGGAYVGSFTKGQRYYQCIGTDLARRPASKKCTPGRIPADRLERAVWAAVAQAVRNPSTLRERYEAQLAEQQVASVGELERKQVAVELLRLQRRDERLLKAYLDEALELEAFKAEKDRIAEQMAALRRREASLAKAEAASASVARAFEQLEALCSEVAIGLDNLTYEEQQEVLRLLVDKIIPTPQKVRIEMVIPPADESDQPVALRPLRPDRSGGARGCGGHRSSATTWLCAQPAPHSGSGRRLLLIG